MGFQKITIEGETQSWPSKLSVISQSAWSGRSRTLTETVFATPKISIIEGKSCLPRGQHVNPLAHWAPTKTLRLYLGPL